MQRRRMALCGAMALAFNMLGFLFEAAVAYAVIAAITYYCQTASNRAHEYHGVNVHSTHP